MFSFNLIFNRYIECIGDKKRIKNIFSHRKNKFKSTIIKAQRFLINEHNYVPNLFIKHLLILLLGNFKYKLYSVNLICRCTPSANAVSRHSFIKSSAT